MGVGCLKTKRVYYLIRFLACLISSKAISNAQYSLKGPAIP